MEQPFPPAHFLAAPNSQGMYIHVPFCRQACSYCDFYFSTQLRHTQAWLEAAQQELRLWASHAPQARPRLSSLYLGGGTPSVLSLAQLAQLFATVHCNYELAPGAEVTLEANPEDLSADYCRGLLSLGVNRLSIGIQSLDDAQLAWMRRGHGGQGALQALDNLRRAGFADYSLDLMFHLPGLQPDDWGRLVDRLLAEHPPHLSAYALTVEPRTLLAHQVAHQQIALPPEETFRLQYQLLHDRAEAVGYRHYELSNYALPNHQARHNTAYWQGAPYLGIGPAAHSYCSPYRWSNPPNLHRYLQVLAQGSLPAETPERLTPQDEFNEHLMLGLRQAAGVNLSDLAERLQRPLPEHWLAEVDFLTTHTALCLSQGRLYMPLRQATVLDGLIARLFLDGD